MKKTKHCILMVISFWTIAHAIAQKTTELKTKFGKLTAEEMKMSIYDKDPEANAVILFDKASLDYEPNAMGYFDCSFKRHVRIKILKKEGYNEADILIPHAEYLKVVDVKAAAHNLEGDKWVESKMKDANIMDEQLNKWTKVKKFTIPQVREGSIIEYKYTIFDDGGGYMPQTWLFQRHIPTIWSEYEVNIPEYYDYLVVPHVDFHFLVAEKREESNRGVLGQRPVSWFVQHQRWVLNHIPALKKEPMMTSISNYQSRLTFQYKGMYQPTVDFVGGEARIRAGIYKASMNTWQGWAADLLKEEGFGEAFKRNLTEDLVESLTTGISDTLAKVKAIYEHIGKNYEVESYASISLRQPFKELLKSHKGGAGELNVLAINMLRAADIEAYPVIISTRSNGYLHPIFPMRDRIDRMIVCLPHVDKEPLFLDVSGYPQPLGLLPFEDLNDKGFMIQGNDKTGWVTLKNKLNTKSLFLNTLIINENGELSGTIAMSSTGYEAFKNRNKIEKNGSEKYANIVLKDILIDGKLEEHKLENTDRLDEKPLKGQFKIKTNAFVTKTDSFMYVSPMLYWAEKENLFKNPDRKFDIDFGYNWENSYILNLTIPEGYKVETMPKSTKINAEDNSFLFTYVTEVVDKQLKINVKWAIKKTLFKAEEYPMLRSGYEAVLNKMNEQIVLSKTK